ncbi:MAG: hypothetical protein JWM83_2674 [Candidatus Angelobacter sp.]|jgi:hypothetical protein|nr:hypothetical protein [Candidatus Angelobacter sp.]
MPTSLDSLNAGIFSQQLRTQFRLLREGAEPIPLELIEVKESDPSPKIELFMLHFRGPSEPRMAQHIHRLEHDKLGAFDIFLTAIGADEQGITYESVFHRFRKTEP